MCPHCRTQIKPHAHGTYVRKSDQKTLARSRCILCRKTFSETIFTLDYRYRKRCINQGVFKLLCSGVSQRRCAFLLEVRPPAVARRLIRFGACSRINLDNYRTTRPQADVVLIDEMESFEHTKCKPLTIPIAVEEKTRKILSLKVGSIAAKGRLAKISVKKYGKRKCERKDCLKAVLSQIKGCMNPAGTIKSDESNHYPVLIRSILSGVTHKAFKGKRGSSTGLGELKKTGFDPLFSLNHSYAMFRDNLKSLARRTWCTTKRADLLECRMYLYSWFHNLWLDRHINKVILTYVATNI